MAPLTRRHSRRSYRHHTQLHLVDLMLVLAFLILGLSQAVSWPWVQRLNRLLSVDVPVTLGAAAIRPPPPSTVSYCATRPELRGLSTFEPCRDLIGNAVWPL